MTEFATSRLISHHKRPIFTNKSFKLCNLLLGGKVSCEACYFLAIVPVSTEILLLCILERTDLLLSALPNYKIYYNLINKQDENFEYLRIF